MQALWYLKSKNIIHRDLKPHNILLTEKNSVERIKIGDFGLAKVITPLDLADTMCGSPLYMAPEILRLEGYDEKSDLWSLGIIIYELIYGHTPFSASNHIHLQKLLDDFETLTFPAGRSISTDCKDLLSRLLEKTPRNRISIRDLRNHPFFMNSKGEGNNSGDRLSIGFHGSDSKIHELLGWSTILKNGVLSKSNSCDLCSFADVTIMDLIPILIKCYQSTDNLSDLEVFLLDEY